MISTVSRFLRNIRTSLKGWSAEKDKAYHDASFTSVPSVDCFTFAYPGYVTLSRMADLASPYLQHVSSAIDIGCGPGEITSILAKRHPQVSFLGIDHSVAAINRANDLAKRLGITNVNFEVWNIEEYSPQKEFDMALLFDSFHHLIDPGKFIRRFQSFTSRFFLIEPRGDWKGTWRKDVDMDWLTFEMHKIASRIEYLLQWEKAQEFQTVPSITNPDDAVENRYCMQDFESFFTGFGLRVEGTTCGLEAYPPNPFSQSPPREYVGRMVYDLLTRTDEWLKQQNMDLLAKHWVIYAERGVTLEKRKVPHSSEMKVQMPQLKGAYDAEYQVCQAPHVAIMAQEFPVLIRIINHSWMLWSSEEQSGPLFLSYHWLNESGTMLVSDGKRTPLPGPIAPGDSREVLANVIAPDRVGKHLLAIELVREGVTWFSQVGVPWLLIPVRIAKH